ncbi:MAG: hypothetical protein ACXVJW_14190 [Acidimicrobiia bacterium]
MVYGVTVQTLGRAAGNGMTMVFVEATDPLTAEARARRIAQGRYGCEVLADHPVPCPGFSPTPDTQETEGS